jgi:glycosyltransferase involved in cell wall biosynthesis
MNEQETQQALDEYLTGRTDLILVTYNRLEFTKKTLQYLERRTTTPHRLIVVDNGSTDGTAEWLTENKRQYTDIDMLVLLEKNYGLEHARAIALAHVSSKYHVYFDNDLVCPAPLGIKTKMNIDNEELVLSEKKDWLEIEIDMMEKYPDYGALAMHPQLLVGASIDLSPSAPEVIQNNHVGATFLIMRTDLMKEVGWRTSFTNRVADWYFGDKFKAKGFKSGWIRDLWCYHFFQKDWGYKNVDHFHREVWPPSEYYDRLVDPYTLEPKDDGVDMLTWEENK